MYKNKVSKRKFPKEKKIQNGKRKLLEKEREKEKKKVRKSKKIEFVLE